MHSPRASGRGRCGSHRLRSPRWSRRGPAVTLALGAVLAVVSALTLLGTDRQAPEVLLPVAAATGPPVPVVVPARAPASQSLGPLRRAAPARLLHVRPVAVAIPSAGVDSALVDLGLNPDRTLQAPADYARAGWFAGGTYPGDADGVPAIIAGHVDSWNGPAVFYPLQQVRVGQEVRVRRADGSVAAFDVYAVHRYPKDAFPADAVYAPTARAELRVITCTGTFDKTRRSYLDNLVLFARLNLAASESAP